jgi:hypothetical protein
MDDRDEKLREIAREITEQNFPLPRWEIGDIVEHPDGYPVRIISGKLWEEFPDGGQRLVNTWTWKRLDAAGRDTGADASGEGWASDPAVSRPSVGH